MNTPPIQLAECQPRRISVFSRHLPKLAAAIALASAAFSIAAFGTAQTVQAASIPVNTTTDELNTDGDCSLREAVQAANTDAAVDACPAGSGADTITLSAATYTFSLAGANEDANATGDLDLTDAAGLVITGAGTNSTLIDAAGIDRALQAIASPLTLTDLTVQNGFIDAGSGSAEGGGIYASGNLTLTSVAVQTNTITSTANTQIGGGLFAAGVTVISNTVFQGNSVPTSGGGAAFAGPLTLSNSTFRGNGTGSAASAAQFSTIADVKNTVFSNNIGLTTVYFPPNNGLKQMTNVSFVDNKVGNGGVTLYADVTVPLNIQHGTFANGSVPTETATAVVANSALMQITNTIIASYTTGIQRTAGSVIANKTLFFGNTTNTTGSSIANSNPVSGNPGFVDPSVGNYRLGANSCAVDAGAVSGIASDFENDIRPQGDGFDIGADESPYTATLGGLSAANNGPKVAPSTIALSATLGSGTCVSYQWNFGDGSPIGTGANVTHTYSVAGTYTATVTATNSITTLVTTTSVVVTAPLVGVCYASLGSTTDYASSNAQAVRDAVAAAPEGSVVKIAGICAGVQAQDSTSQTVMITQSLTLAGGYTTTNWTTPNLVANPTILDAQNGGRVIRANASVFTVTGITVQRGASGSDDGAGIYLAGNTLNLINSQVLSNTNTGRGGGAYAYVSANISGTLFRNNTTGGNYGGGFYSFTGGDIYITNSQFISNTGDGGGALIDGGANNFVIANTQFLSNTGAGSGGGFSSFAANTVVTGSLFQGNRANASGGGLHSFYNLTVTNTRFIANSANSGGGLVNTNLFEPKNATVVNSLFAGNTANLGTALYANGNFTLTHSTIASPTVAAGSAIYFDGFSAARAVITNTLIASHTLGIQRSNGTVVENYNLYSGITTTFNGASISAGGNSLTNTAGFVNPAAGDYHLAPNSCAINTGTNVGINRDFEGEVRPQSGAFDIGFDESPYSLTALSGLAAFNNGPKPINSAVNFTSTLSAGSCALYAWNFGDGSPAAKGPNASHTYTSSGNYLVTLTAANNGGTLTATTQVSITTNTVNTTTVTAYNDFNNFNGQSQANASTISFGSGLLKNFADGSATGVTLIATGDTMTPLNSGAHPTGGDALAIFGPSGTTANGAGLIDNVSTNPITLVLQGMTDNVPYDLVLYSDRAFTPGTRLVAYTLTGADSFTNNSSVGSTLSGPGNATTTLDIMNNGAIGRVARFSNIDVGSDGRIIMVLSRAGGSNPAVQLNALRLQWSTAPVAISGFSVSNDSPKPVGSLVNFFASVATGSNVAYSWSFGDNSQVVVGNITGHVYNAPGIYTTRVTATNSVNTVVATTLVTITANTPVANWQIDNAGVTADLSNVSCPTTTSCKAVGNNGAILAWNGSSWSAQASGVPTDFINGVSCTSANFCKAVTGEGDILTWNGTAWSTDTTVFSSLYTVSCASNTFCVAVGSSLLTNIYMWNGNAWSDATSPSDALLWGVSCPTANFCKAVGDGGVTLTWNGAAWSNDNSGTTQALNAVDCLSPSFCKAVGLGGTIRTWNGSAWSADASGTGTTLQSVSCSTPSLCKATGLSGTIRTWNGSAWSSDTSNTSQQLLGVDCADSSNCVAVGTGGTIRRLGAALPPPPPLPPTISGVPLRSATVGQLYQFAPSASDPQNRPLTFAIANKPTWASFSTATGVLSGTPGSGDVGTFASIEIGVSNGLSTTKLLPFDLTVNLAPTANPVPYDPKSFIFRAALGTDFITQTLIFQTSSMSESQDVGASFFSNAWSTVNYYSYNAASVNRPLRPDKAQFNAIGTYARQTTAVFKGQAITVPVTIIVEPAQLVVSRSELRFSGETSATIATQALRIESSSSIAAVGWTASANQPWVTLSALSGSTPQTVTVGIDSSKLSIPGSYTASVVLKDVNGKETPITVLATIVAPGALPIELLALEATQGVQNQQNDMALVANRRTFIRAHVRSTTGIALNKVTAQLTATLGATAQKLDPKNPSGAITVLPTPNRLNTDDSFLFELPSNFLTGTVNLEFKGISQPIACRDINNTANDCKVTLVFSQVLPTVPIKFYLTSFQYDGVTYTSNLNHVGFAQQGLMSFLPLSGLTVSTADTVLTYNGTDILSNLLKLTNNIRTNEGSPKTLYHSLLSTVGGGHLGGLANRPGYGGASSIGLGTFLNIVPHEVGHNLGLYHVNCGNPAGIDYSMPVTISAGITNPVAQYYGFDINTLTVRSPDNYDTMTYCQPSWPSFRTFQFAIDSIKNRFAPTFNATNDAQTVMPQKMFASAGNDVIYVSGVVTGTQTGAIQSVFGRTSDSAIPAPETGPYVLRLEGTGGQVIASYNFAVNGSGETNNDGFSVALPHKLSRTGAVKTIVLLYGDSELSRVTASANEPVVSNGSTQSVSSSQLNVTWTNSDADNNPLNYVLEYNPDGTWRTAVAGNVTGNNFTVPVNPNLWPGSNVGQLRVAVNDGFYTTWYTFTQNISVAKKVPVASIAGLSASAGTAIYQLVGNQSLNLQGQGFDRESGQLTGNSLKWYSDRDGLLGSGEALQVNGDGLSVGHHIITLVATDGDGNSSLISDANSQPSDPNPTVSNVAVDVYRDRPSLPAQLQVSPANLDLTVLSGQTLKITLPVRNGGDGDLSWTANTNGAPAWLNLSAVSGTAPSDLELTVNATDVAAGVYSGTLTFQSSNGNAQTVSLPYSVQVIQPSVAIYMPLVQR